RGGDRPAAGPVPGRVRAGRRGRAAEPGDRGHAGAECAGGQEPAAPGPDADAGRPRAALRGGDRAVSCDELIEKLMDYLDGELVEEQRTLVEVHLDSCPNCPSYVETYTHTVRVVRRLPRCGLPPAVEQRLRAALKEHLCDSAG